MKRNLYWGLTAGLLALFLGLHLSCVTAPWFVADDAQELAFVRGAESFRMLFGADSFGLFRPVKNLLFYLFSALSSVGGTAACRLLAVSVGIASYFAVDALMKRVFGDDRKALLASGIWLLAPTMVSQIAWLSCLNIQVMVAFAALAVVFHDSRRAVLSAVMVFLSCVSYECAVAVGPMIVVFDFFIRPERFADRRQWWRYAVVFGVVLGFLLLRGAVGAASSVNGSFANVTRGEICAAAAYFSCQHFLSWLWPFGRFAIFGGYAGGSVAGWCTAACWGVLSVFAAGALCLRGKHPRIGLGIAFALVGFLPVSNITGAGNGPYGDYYLALSSLGLSIALAGLAGLHRWVLLAVVTLRLLLVPEAWHWTSLWTDADRGLVESTEDFPGFFGNHIMLSQRCHELGAHELSRLYGDRVEGIVGPESGQMGTVYLIRALYEINVGGNATNALELIEKSRKTGDFGGPLRNRGFYRGCVYEDLLNDHAAAEKEYRSALRGKWNVDSVQPADRLARLLAVRGKTEEAVELWTKALRWQPDNAGIRHNLAVASSALRSRTESKP